MPSQNHALVFGASGITGWAIVNAILSGYPSPGTFARLTAITNRPLPASISQWPEDQASRPGRPEFLKVHGIDLLPNDGSSSLSESNGDAGSSATAPPALVDQLKSAIPHVETVSHVYFFAYTMRPDGPEEVAINKRMLANAITAVEQLAGANLKFVVLPSGTKRYGVHLLDKFPFTPPLHENLPRIPEPYASEMFYYGQLDTLTNLSRNKGWTWCEIIPDVIVGFVPNNNVYCLAQQLAIYLSLYRHVRGEGAVVPFPGTHRSWKNLSNDSPQDVVAHFAIFASLNPDECGGGKGWNTADSPTPKSWSVKWPIICSYFGLVGVGPLPEDGSEPPAPQVGEFVTAHVAEWEQLEQKYGLQRGRVVGNDRSFAGFPQYIMSTFDFDRQLDMANVRRVWGERCEEMTTEEGWYTAFDRFRRARIIPPAPGDEERE